VSERLVREKSKLNPNLIKMKKEEIPDAIMNKIDILVRA